MGVEFSAKISMLRKESEITQRQAAQELGISQALLSHYEKGIRECSLEFVKKAALYYGVTADFLLGLTDAKKGNRVTFDAETENDGEAVLTQESVIRSLLFLSDRSAKNGESGAAFFTDYFSLAIKKYVSLFSENALTENLLNDLAAAALTEALLKDRRRKLDLSDAPRSFNTVIGAADSAIKNTVSSLTK